MSETREPNLLHRTWRTPMRDLVRGRVTQRLDWNAVIDEASVPGDLKKLVRRLVRRTRLWRLEKAEVARELIQHFEDALASGVSSDEAADRFGDWGKAARLIRRAQKRKRPLLWHAYRWSFWCVVVLLVWYVAMGVYYFSGSRNIAVDYAAFMNEQAAAVPEEERAWPAVRQSLLAMGLTSGPGQPGVRQLIDEQTIRPGDADWPAVAGFLEQHHDAIDGLRRAASMPGLGYVAGYYEDADDLALFDPNKTVDEHQREVAELERRFADEPPMTWMILLPHLSSLRTSARVLSLDAFRAAEAGDENTVYANLVAMLGLADHANEQNVLINQLVALAIQRTALITLSELLADGPALLSDQHLTDLAHRIAAVRVYKPDLSGERAFMDDLIQHLYTDNGKGNGHLDVRSYQRYSREFSHLNSGHLGLHGETGVARVFGTAITPAAAMIVADRKTITGKADYLYTLYEADMAKPMWQQPESRAEHELIDMSGGSSYQKMRYSPILSAMPAIGAVRTTAERHAAQADGAITALALELYRREQGDYPETLDALVPRYLPEHPIDRITGDPLLYRILEGQPILYSVGTDRDDDGGSIVYDENGDRNREAIQWAVDENEQPVDGDWVVWPLHDKRDRPAD